jgi:Flp pilus assembly protein CpaB
VKRSNRLILLIGILLAAVAFVGIILVFNNQGKGGTAEVPQANVVVANRDIKLGDAITDRDVTTQQIPLADAKPEYFKQPGDVIGQVARTDIAKGAFLTQSMFSGTGQQSIAKDLPAGLVAVAVRIDAVTGVGTLILPGDRVDVVVTLGIAQTLLVPGAEPSAPPQAVDLPGLSGDSSKVILQNIEVRGVLGASASSGTTDTTGTAPDLTGAQQVVILGMTPQQAEVVQFLQQDAKSMGTALSGNNLTLILRSPKDKDAPAVETTGVVLKTLIEDYGVLPPQILEASLPPTK